MNWYEVLIIIACALIVVGVTAGSVIRKKRNKAKGGCGCGCSGCSGCSEYNKIMANAKKRVKSRK